MPTPAFFESQAHRFWPHRWTLGLSALAAPLVLMGVMFLAQAFGLERRLPFHLLFAAVLLIYSGGWGLMLVGVWFHPERGTMRVGSPWFLRMPRFIQVAWRWYAAFFLALWFCLPIAVIPMMLF